MKKISTSLLIMSLSVSTGALAGNVTMLKEGNYEFYWCGNGHHLSMSATDKVFVSHYHLAANAITPTPGQPFDRVSGACYGTHATLSGRNMGFGVCEITDMDGDKWWMEYHENADGSGGTYSNAHGTGKYDGMTLKGQYVLTFWPTSKGVDFQTCNRNTGTYKLK